METPYNTVESIVALMSAQGTETKKQQKLGEAGGRIDKMLGSFGMRRRS